MYIFVLICIIYGEKMINTLLIDDDIYSIQDLFNEIYAYPANNCKILKISCSKIEIQKLLQERIIDIVILNINMNKLNAYDILNILKEKKILNRTIVISKNIDQNLERFKYIYTDIFSYIIMPKNQKKLSQSLKELAISTNEKECNANKINKLLEIFTFNKSSLGYKYIVNFLDICINKKYTYIPKIYIICNEIAKKNNLNSSQKIDWNIQRSIKFMKNYTDSAILKKYFKFYPSTKIFLNKILSLYYNIYK